jgi:hypothetical protein
MDTIASWSKIDRADLLREAGTVKNMAPAVVEKDFWVCWVLDKLFGSDSMAERSVTKQGVFNKKLLHDTHVYLKEVFLSEVETLIGDVCKATIEDNPEVVRIRYPASFSSEYLRPDVQLEVGPLASSVPNAEYEITPYAAEAFPHVFSRPTSRVRSIKAERTFWEKVTILHHEANRPEGTVQPKGYSRHYYDVCRMAQSTEKDVAFRDLELLKDVVAFKDKFYRRGWARYDLAVPGTMKLVPPEHVKTAVARDYDEMRFMIYGEVPAFDDLMRSIQQLEDTCGDNVISPVVWYAS